MKDALVRFGVAMEQRLLEGLDALVEERGSTRSELLRDLVRAEVTRARVSEGGHAVATLTLVYDHHVRDLTERLTEFQHALGEKVNSVLHVHLDHHHCLEVVVMRGPAAQLKRAADKLLATRGVKHGGIEFVVIDPRETPHDHAHPHGREVKKARVPKAEVSREPTHAHPQPQRHDAKKSGGKAGRSGGRRRA